MYKTLWMFLGVVLVAVSPAGIFAQCFTGEITSEVSADPGFEGLYKYTISGDWVISGSQYALSHVEFLMAFDCPCACDEGVMQFAYPAGESEGITEDEPPLPCTVYYLGLIDCIVSPPRVKMEVIPGQTCFANTTGHGEWTFYTVFSPLPYNEYTDVVIVKYGVEQCLGNLSGYFPDCSCEVGTGGETWGSIKATYE